LPAKTKRKTCLAGLLIVMKQEAVPPAVTLDVRAPSVSTEKEEIMLKRRVSVIFTIP